MRQGRTHTYMHHQHLRFLVVSSPVAQPRFQTRDSGDLPVPATISPSSPHITIVPIHRPPSLVSKQISARAHVRWHLARSTTITGHKAARPVTRNQQMRFLRTQRETGSRTSRCPSRELSSPVCEWMGLAAVRARSPPKATGCMISRVCTAPTGSAIP
jgi:hypothetical protein